MYEKKSFKTFISKTLHSFTTFFTFTLFVRLFIKIIATEYYNKVHGIYTGETIDLTLYAILEIAAFSLILAVINLLILSDFFLVKMKFLLRSFLFFIAILFLTTAFAVFFNWLDIDNSLAWISFFLTFVICFAIGISVKLLKFRFDDKKYNKLLERYKSRYNTDKHS